MSLAPGTRLGPYEILAPLGSGGMGEVWKARDTRLDRTVAIKTTAAHLSDRFEREARAIAALNHPHICQIYDVGADYLVMELIDGRPLAGPLPVDQALKYAIEICDALDAAHRKGITHRDLKPANLLVTKTGIKLLDFGVAKISPTARPDDATLSMAITGKNEIVGTLYYMSPEQLQAQANGQEIDARSDIFSFGLVLYEMLTGKRAFEGSSAASVIAGIMERPAPSIAGIAPPALDRVLRKCLAKSPDDRWQSARDLRDELEWIAGPPVETHIKPASARSSRTLFLLGSALIAMLVLGLWTFRRSGGATSAPGGVTRLLMALNPAEALLGPPEINQQERPSRTALVWTPDGQALIFSGIRAGIQQLFLRRIDQLEATPINGTEGAVAPFVSPDGHWIGFWAHGELKKVPAAGGPPVSICKSRIISAATWGDGDTIFFNQGEDINGQEGIWRVSASGGAAVSVASPDTAKGAYSYRLPQVLPGGKTLLFTVTRAAQFMGNGQIAALSLETGKQKIITDGADARYVAPGYLVFMRMGALFAAPFDPRKAALTGEAEGILDGVMQSAQGPTYDTDIGAGQFSVSSTGSLAYVPGGVFSEDLRSLVWVDRGGAVTPIDMPPRVYWAPRLSRDGRRLAVYSRGAEGRVWIHDFSSGATTPLTDPGGTSDFPVWGPDDHHVTFAQDNPSNLFWREDDAGSPVARLATSTDAQAPNAWSPDGAHLAITQTDPRMGSHIWVLSFKDGHSTLNPWLTSPFQETCADFSPDGRWLAYTSNESGRNEVYVAPYPGPGSRYPVSNKGGECPAWSRDGHEISYWVESGSSPVQGTMMAAAVSYKSGEFAAAPRKLFEGDFWLTFPGRGYDVSADGRRFVMVQPRRLATHPVTQIVIVGNWTQELTRLVSRP